METLHIYLKHQMNPGDGEFLAKVELQFCPRIGETIVYFDKEYTVEKIQHLVGVTKVIISEL